MLTLKQKLEADILEADIKEMEYLTEVLKATHNWDKEAKRSIRIQGVINDLELVKRSLKQQIKH